MVKKLLSICNKIYNKLTNKDTVAVQQNIIESYERELQNLKVQVAQCTDRERVASRGRSNSLVDNKVLQSRIDDLCQIRTRLEKELHIANNKPDVVHYEKQFVMTQKVYDELERALEAPIVTNNTSAQGAGYLVGMQRVLAEVRKRYVTNN